MYTILTGGQAERSRVRRAGFFVEIGALADEGGGICFDLLGIGGAAEGGEGFLVRGVGVGVVVGGAAALVGADADLRDEEVALLPECAEDADRLFEIRCRALCLATLELRLAQLLVSAAVLPFDHLRDGADAAEVAARQLDHSPPDLLCPGRPAGRHIGVREREEVVQVVRLDAADLLVRRRRLCPLPFPRQQLAVAVVRLPDSRPVDGPAGFGFRARPVACRFEKGRELEWIIGIERVA
jgi:hypothetical protein